SNQHQRVLLEVVADARNVGRHLDPVREPDARDLAQRRIRFLRGLREDADAHAALLRAVLQRGALGLAHDLLATLAYELADRRHSSPRKMHRHISSPRTAAVRVVSGLKAVLRTTVRTPRL